MTHRQQKKQNTTIRPITIIGIITPAAILEPLEEDCWLEGVVVLDWELDGVVLGSRWLLLLMTLIN